jgi:sugar porter (SP) family MFS transporter
MTGFAASAGAPTTPAAPVNLAYLLPICLVATLGGLLFGFDTGVISGAIEPMTAHFQLDGAMKGWVSACVLIGCTLGVLLVGPLSDRYGRRPALVLAGLLFLISSIGTALPESVTLFVIFRILAGVGIGFASMVTPMYIAEIAPAHLRGRLVAANQIAIVVGLAGVYVGNYVIAGLGDQAWLQSTGWRWMFAAGILPAAGFLALLATIPESPRWLMERGRLDRARVVLARISGTQVAEGELASIRTAIAAESGTWRMLFSPTLRRPLLIGIALAVLQQVTGINVFMYFGASIFRSLGESTGVDAGLLQQAVIGGGMILFTFAAILLVDRWGRRPLMIVGTSGMMLALIAMGAVAQVSADPAATGMLMLALILLYTACFSLSIGPVTWVILAEIFPTAVRGRALGIAVAFLWMADFLVTQTFPMLDGNRWLLEHFRHAFPFYLYAGCCAVLLVVMRAVPETKGRSLEEIERAWSARGASGSARG